MTQIQAYLHFSGNCRQAMTFYQECFGGELHLQTVGESPLAEQMPAEASGHILHACLTNRGLVVQGSDIAGVPGSVSGNSVSLLLDCSSESEINSFHSRLASGGQVTHPLENTFWGALFGDLIDQFGTHWYLNFNKEQPA